MNDAVIVNSRPDLCFHARLNGGDDLTPLQRHAAQVAFVRNLQLQIGNDDEIVNAYGAWEIDRESASASVWIAVHARAARSALAGLDAVAAWFSLEWISDV